MLIENVDYFVRVVQFPNCANKGAVFLNDDGTYDVYLNSRYPDLIEGYEHEVRHLLCDHLYSNKPIECIENEANGNVILPKMLASGEKRRIPVFKSLGAIRKHIVMLNT